MPGAVIDTSQITAEELTYAGAGGARVKAYLARPAAEGACPGLIVIHEASGLGDHIRDVVRRFANAGYLTLGVDLYTREGGPPPAGDMEAILQRLFSMPDERILADLQAGVDLLRARVDCSGRVGCIGFCMGGRLTLLLACSSDAVDAAVDCWGGFIDAATLEQRSTPQRPTPPLDLADEVHCPLYVAIGLEDTNPSPEVGRRLQQALADSEHETIVDFYEGAGHAFFADRRPTYRPEAARLLWRRVLPFLSRHLEQG